MIDVGELYGGKQYKRMPVGTEDGTGVKPITVPQVAGTEYTEVMFTAFCHDMWLQADASGIAEGESAIITVEGSLDNVGWDSLSMVTGVGTAATTVIAANGTTLFYFRDAPPAYVRVRIQPTLVSGSVFTMGIQAYFAVLS